MADRQDDRIAIQNVVSPDHVQRVSRAKYMAMKQALLAVLPAAPPGMTPSDAKAALLPHLSATAFPGGEKAGWWLKAVQLDLEAKGEIRRIEKPVRLYKAAR